MLQIATLDPHTKGLIYENGEEIDRVHFDFYSEDRAEWERLADERLREAGYRRVSQWRDANLDEGFGAATVADIVRA